MDAVIHRNIVYVTGFGAWPRTENSEDSARRSTFPCMLKLSHSSELFRSTCAFMTSHSYHLLSMHKSVREEGRRCQRVKRRTPGREAPTSRVEICDSQPTNYQPIQRPSQHAHIRATSPRWRPSDRSPRLRDSCQDVLLLEQPSQLYRPSQLEVTVNPLGMP